MKFIALIVLVLTLGAGVLFAFWTAPVTTVSSSSAAGPATVFDGNQLVELREAIDALAARVERLEVREPTLSAEPAAAQRVAADAVTPEELAEMREMVAAIKDPTAATGVPFESMVLGVLENREAIEEAERDQRRAEAAAERIEQRVAELAEQLGLSSYQSGEMLTILTDESTTRDAFFTEMRESGVFDRSTIRDKMEGLRTETLASVEKVLSPDQYDRYVEESSDGFGFGRGGDRGEGRGPGGGGGR